MSLLYLLSAPLGASIAWFLSAHTQTTQLRRINMHIDMLILFLKFTVMTLFILMIGYSLLLIEYALSILNIG